MSLTDILSPSDIAAALRDCQGEPTTKTLNPFCVAHSSSTSVPKEHLTSAWCKQTAAVSSLSCHSTLLMAGYRHCHLSPCDVFMFRTVWYSTVEFML